MGGARRRHHPRAVRRAQREGALGASGWRTTIVDALGAAFGAALGTVAGCVRGAARVVLSLPLAVALVVKRAMLAADPSDHDAVLRGWSVAARRARLAAFASLEGARAQRLRRLGGLHLQGSTKLLSDEEARRRRRRRRRPRRRERGATVGRLISLASVRHFAGDRRALPLERVADGDAVPRG